MGIYGEKSASDVKTPQDPTTLTTKANATTRMIGSLTVKNVVGERQRYKPLLNV